MHFQHVPSSLRRKFLFYVTDETSMMKVHTFKSHEFTRLLVMYYFTKQQ
ncbi:hypothetical protein [Paenibacillus shirakamiensis]|nr:hypothetical protein [Paenibacillus shirakamiensis]